MTTTSASSCLKTALFQQGVPPRERLKAARALAKTGGVKEPLLVERELNERCTGQEDYGYRCKSLLYSLCLNPSLLQRRQEAHLCYLSDRERIENTIVETIMDEQAKKIVRMEELLSEKLSSKQNGGGDASTLIRCRKCKGTDIAYTQKQTRSADEAMTVFLECLTCKERWRS